MCFYFFSWCAKSKTWIATTRLLARLFFTQQLAWMFVFVCFSVYITCFCASVELHETYSTLHLLNKRTFIYETCQDDRAANLCFLSLEETERAVFSHSRALHTLIQTQLFLHQQILVPKILLSPAVVCQIMFCVPTYTWCFQYYLKSQAGGLPCQRNVKVNHYNHQDFCAVWCKGVEISKEMTRGI